ncbi:MAG TPA: portal protein, partial [Ramlibacter sp.]|nr:portal protein [Ramlibacter sp.]
PFRCVDDPDAVDPAGADRRFFFIEEELDEDEFTRQHPDAQPIDWQFDTKDGWFTANKKVRVAEYYEVCSKKRKLFLWANGETSYEGDPMPQGVYIGELPLKTRTTEQRYVKWRKITGKEVLEEKDLPWKWIPVARAWGNHFVVDGKVYVSGIIRNAKDSQRMYNVAQSAIVERVMQAPKAPWLAPIEAIQGYEKVWATANTGNHAFLPYNHADETGPIPPPQRNMPATVEPGLIQIAQASSDDIKSETGQYDASLGNRSNETSGKAIMARQREGDMATFHYVDNLARMVRHVGRIILDMVPHIYDTRRVARILGEDGSPANAVLDPKLPQPLVEQPSDNGELQRIFNPSVGTYDVYTTTGPSFTTRRQEAVEAMSQMTQANPELWRVIGDQLIKNMDWPGAEEMAQRLKAVLLPEVRQASEEQGPQIPPEVMAQVQQMTAQMEQMGQALQAASAKVQELEQDKQQAFNDQLIKAYDAETKRLQALGSAMSPEAVQALVMQTLQQVLTSPDPTPRMEPPPMGAMPIPQEPASAGFSLPEGAATGA